MSEYTPTNNEVRAQWGIAVDHHRRPERLAEFDRMIAEVTRTAVEGFAQMSSTCILTISPGDEEMWIKCSCGWVVEPSPWPHDTSLDDAFQAWYWPHGIKSQTEAEETAGDVSAVDLTESTLRPHAEQHSQSHERRK